MKLTAPLLALLLPVSLTAVGAADAAAKSVVTVLADILGLGIKPPADGPTNEREFLLKYLTAAPGR